MGFDNKNSKRFGVLVCEDAEKWGGKSFLGGRLETLLVRDGDEWCYFDACAGHLPSEQDLHKFQGFITTGSHYSVNDDKEWIRQAEKLIVSLAKNPTTSPRLVGLCFGHQLIAKALGGEVGPNPSGKFLLGSEKVNSTKENSVVSKLFKNGPLNLLESHSECVTKLPPKAQSIATSNSCEHEIVLFNEKMLGIQCHPEFSGEEFEEKILPSLLSKDVLSEAEGSVVQQSLRVPLDSKQVNCMLSEFLHQ